MRYTGLEDPSKTLAIAAGYVWASPPDHEPAFLRTWNGSTWEDEDGEEIEEEELETEEEEDSTDEENDDDSDETEVPDGNGEQGADGSSKQPDESKPQQVRKGGKRSGKGRKR